MYSKTAISGPLLGAGGVLPFTGLSFSLMWAVLAAFALLSAGGALLRVAPSLHSQPAAPRRGSRTRRR